MVLSCHTLAALCKGPREPGTFKETTMVMSLALAMESVMGQHRVPRRAVRKVCAGCERQRALFRHHGIVKWDRHHTLCLRCFRAQVNRLRLMAAGTSSSPARS